MKMKKKMPLPLYDRICYLWSNKMYGLYDLELMYGESIKLEEDGSLLLIKPNSLLGEIHFTPSNNIESLLKFLEVHLPVC